MKALLCDRFTLWVLFSTTFALLIPGSAHALPGDTFQQAENTLRSSTLFEGVPFPTEQPGLQHYSLKTPYDEGEAVLYLYLENGTVRSEVLQLRYPDTAISFEREGGLGLELVASTWGEGVAQDFAASRYTDVIEEPHRSPSYFYLGEQYGYMISTLPEHQGDSGIYTLSVMDHAAWEEARQLNQFCVTNPNHEDCLGL
ncbi:MAG: hypothetical protein AAFQ89_09185 [Cyanobacteria bacterium J06626_18]